MAQWGWEAALLKVSLTHSLTSLSQGPADAQGSSDIAKRAGGLQVPSSAGLGGPWPRWTPLQWARGEGLLLTALAQAAEVAGRGCQACPGTLWEHLAPSPGLQSHRDAPSPGCEILSWLIQLAQLTLAGTPSSLPCSQGETEARGWQD